ncbi:hypothetical protein [Chryseobacterium salviniae]|uniref:DNA polymerase I n=1 Tax=Chryseobacterium salviniae TaxID=3101750 RepID=A0ABU6HXB7_9FLAO|nr:hypothetical protein [Chryseobacterium sp. T9W2-O]MEC3877686.1 hypothetical protein [Chryseobacterium sp. T9W2-O]
MKKIRIPSSVPVNEIFEDFEIKYERYLGEDISATELANIKDAILLLLHFLLPLRIEKHEKTGYFKTLNSKIFNNLTGKKFKVAKDILMDERFPVIECDQKYYEGKSYGYKLIDEYFMKGGSILYESYGKLITKYYRNVDQNRNKIFPKLDFLRRKLTKRITTNGSALDFLDHFFKKFDDRIRLLNSEEFDIYQVEKKRKIIEIVWRNDLGLISDGIFGVTESESCQRFSSVFTRLKRELRHFIEIDCEETVEIDLKSSQPYFLNQILNSDFYDSNNSFSLKSIFAELYNELFTTKRMVKIDNNNFNYILGHPYLLTPHKFNLMKIKDELLYNNIYNDCKIQEIFNYKVNSNYNDSIYHSFISTNNNIKYYIYSDIRLLYNGGSPPLSYMCGKIEDVTDIREFKSMNFHVDFYQHLTDYLGLSMTRERVKERFQLFLNNSGDRNKDFISKCMRRYFPNVNRIVEFFLRVKFEDPQLRLKYKNPFSLLLQRIESYHLLQVGVKNFCDHFPKEPVVTIHDSVIVKKSHQKDMIKYLKDATEKITGIPVRFDVKNSDPFESVDDLINQYLNDCRI